MNEIQSIKEPKAENSVNATAVGTATVDVGATHGVAAKASVVETLRVLGTQWAGTAIGYGRVALENVAHALERTAEKLGTLQEKLKKGESPTIIIATH